MTRFTEALRTHKSFCSQWDLSLVSTLKIKLLEFQYITLDFGTEL